MRNTIVLAAVMGLAATLSGPGFAVDGVTLISQEQALQGGVTPDDAPGFPITLSLPGSYRFVTNIEPTRNKNGIEVRAADVSIDLNGFRMHGLRAANTGIWGFADRLTVRNGSITGFRNMGILTSQHFLTVQDMLIHSNVQNGVYAFPKHYHRILNSTIAANGGTGVLCADICSIQDSVISGNNGEGIIIVGGTVSGNTIARNALFGIRRNPIEPGVVGYGNNTISDNAGGQVQGAIPLDPNACSPAC